MAKKDLFIFCLTVCICSSHFNFSSMSTPRNLTHFVGVIVVFVIVNSMCLCSVLVFVNII